MSSEAVSCSDSGQFRWTAACEQREYVQATYYIESYYDPEWVAVGLAREQSAVATFIRGHVSPESLDAYTARVREVRRVERPVALEPLASYHLKEPDRQGVHPGSRLQAAEVTLAHPVANFGAELTCLWNTVAGEVHRLGFVNALRVKALELPESLAKSLPGPMFGSSGIREALAVEDRPLFCRSSRPAVGISTDTMIAINREVLLGGFDMVKDDELTGETVLSPFKDRVRRMAAMVRELEQETGERKMYICNVIASPAKALQYAEVGIALGADALLVAPALQGLEICADIARRCGRPILAHNAWQDAVTRPLRLGVEDSVLFRLYHLSGADMVMMPGSFATDGMSREEARKCVAGCGGGLSGTRHSLPVLAGGKTAASLQSYAAEVGSPDFMVIAATAVDEHPGGLMEGAKAFRDSWSELKRELR